MSADLISAAEMAGIIRRTLNVVLSGIADSPDGASFELTAPATGQRFRVTVAEVPGWSARMDAELGEVTGDA